MNDKIIINESYKDREKVLKVNNLRVTFKSDSGLVYAVRGVSFDLYKGETLCIVGESGSGKSVTSKTIMGILPNNAIIENGQIMYEGEDLVRVSEEEFHRIRGHKIGMIFQDPLSSLNPIMKVGKQITEATMINNDILKKRYNELISRELVAYRNNKANFQYEISKAKAEIEVLKEFLKEYQQKLKLVAKDKFEEDNDSKSIEEKMTEHFRKIINIRELEIANLDEQIDRCLRHKEETEDELLRNIYDIRIANYQNVKETLSSITNDESVSYEDRIAARITFLKDFQKLSTAQYKQLKPLLSQSLKAAKAKAKTEVDAYKAEITKERDDKLAELNAKLAENTAKTQEFLQNVSASDPDLYNRILKTEAQNFQIKKDAEKAKKHNFEINITNVAVNDEIEYVEMPSEEYKNLLDQKEAISKEIEEVKEEFVNKTKITRKEAKRQALEVMREVGIPLPERRYKQYPFEFSGGMRQRIVIAIALTANPDILICDEPTTALDVTIQAQILELINKLKVERGLSCIFITHDLGVVANMADRVAVMYAGKIIEYGQAEEIFFDPQHPYTWALLSSIPDIDSKEKLEAIPGTPPDLRFPPKGDAFALRSKYAMSIDFKYEPPYFKVSDTHYAATWLLYPGAPKVEMPRIVRERIKNALKEDK